MVGFQDGAAGRDDPIVVGKKLIDTFPGQGAYPRRDSIDLKPINGFPYIVDYRDPSAYLEGVLPRLPTQRASEIDQLLPHSWQPD